MYLLLLFIGGSTVFQLLSVHRAEKLRSVDSKLLRLAASQASLSQYVSRFSTISQQEHAEQEMRRDLKQLADQAIELRQLLAQELSAPVFQDYRRRDELQAAVTVWRVHQFMLVESGTELLAMAEAGQIDKQKEAAARVQLQADLTLATSDNLAQQIQLLVNERSVGAVATINHWIAINIVLMLILAAGVVEPTILLVRRQYKKIRHQAGRLESLASERERLASVSWLEAQSAARKVTEEKIMFLATGSHDLRTPLQTIISTVVSMSRDCEAGVLASKFSVDISKLRIACEHIVGIADDLGEFVRDAENYTTQAKKPVHLSDVILKVYDLYYEEAVQSGLQLELIEHHQTDRVCIEENMFRRVMSNLIANAIKYTPRGSVKIVTASPGKDLLRISVSDTGIGIDSAQITDIAKPFFRVSASRHLNKLGLGLGLSIVDKFVGHMGGTWSVTSALKRGSTFIVELPIGPTAPMPLRLPAQPAVDDGDAALEAANAPSGHVTPHGVILFVDDDTELLQGLCNLVDQREGWKPVGFSHVGQALDYLNRHTVSCCFVDLQMHPISGYEFAQRVKDDLGDCAPCLIAMSAYALDRDQEHLFELYVSKPISLHKLMNAVQRVGVLAEPV
ncbi:MAG: hybrid sensor histidine kinase/response regulator [Pseudomonadota bacterium]